MADFRPLGFPLGDIAPWDGLDVPIGTSPAVLTGLTSLFPSLGRASVSGDVVGQLRSASTIFANFTIPATQQTIAVVEPAPVVAVPASTPLLVRLTSVGSMASDLTGYYVLDSGYDTDISGEPFTLDEVRQHLRVSTATDDGIISRYVVAARSWAERVTGKAIKSRTETLLLDAFPTEATTWFEGVQQGPISTDSQRYLQLPYGSLQSVTSIKTYDDADVSATFDSANYYVDAERARVHLRAGSVWPTPLRVADGVEVVWVTGYATAAAIPLDLKQAMLGHIASLYEKRGDVDSVLPDSSFAIYSSYRVAEGSI